MILYEKGNLLESGCDIIIHQVNCQKVMGSGIAKQIRDRWPHIYKEYCKFIDYRYDNGLCRYSCDFLGMIQPLLVMNPLVTDNGSFYKGCLITNFFSQDNYLPRGVCHTDYQAFRQCCKELKNFIIEKQLQNCIIGFPYKIGCGLAGGDWSIVSKIIEEELSEYNIEIWEYEK